MESMRGLLWPLFSLPFCFVKKKTHLERETKAKKVIIFSLFENVLYFTQIKKQSLLIFTPVLSSVLSDFFSSRLNATHFILYFFYPVWFNIL